MKVNQSSRIRRSAIRFSAFLFLVIAVLFGCGQASFEGSTAKRRGNNDAKPNPADPSVGSIVNDGSEVFDLTKTNGKLDLIWVIDNSGSMADKIAKVQRNLDQFIDSVSERTDLKVILVSSAGYSGSHNTPFGGLDIKLSNKALSEGHVQIDVRVGSYNSLALTAAAFCSPDQTSYAPQGSQGFGGAFSMKICGDTYYSEDFSEAPGTGPGESWIGKMIDEPEKIAEAAGTLREHIRPQATKAIVFVTDENSFNFGADEFSKVMSSELGGNLPQIFSFQITKEISIYNPSSSCAGIQGKAYTSLINNLGGKSFDICEDDWSNHFDTLSANVSTIANNRFNLQKQGVKIIGVEVDGRKLSSSDYTVDGNTVTVNQGVLQESAQKVTVFFE